MAIVFFNIVIFFFGYIKLIVCVYIFEEGVYFFLFWLYLWFCING